MSALVAAALDATAGEPPEISHPVVWTGRYLAAAERVAPAAPPLRAVVAGVLVWAVGAAGAVGAGRAAERLAAGRSPLTASLVRGVALWPLLSVRMLITEVQAVERASHRDPEAGRVALARIVSRDTSGLSPAEVRAAALESLAENLSDSVVAPLLWYGVAGLPGAALYRFANTADACWGYRTPRWNHTGRMAARADDALNLVPARLTAALLRGRVPRQDVRREAGRTSSPNAGWPMAALALRLDVRLAKRGHYELNAKGSDPGPDDVTVGVRVATRAALVAFAVTAAVDLIRHRGGAP